MAIAEAPRPTRKPRRAGRRSEVANRIRSFRLDMGMSPETFGRQVGLSGMTIRRIEDGRANPASLHPRTKFLIAEQMEEKVSALWPL